MNLAEKFLQEKINQRLHTHTFRTLTAHSQGIDFSSNDYLGFAHSDELRENIKQEISKITPYKNGATGARLLSGNTKYTEELEQFIASFHDAESGLIFNSGYDANIGLLSSIPQRNDTIITDEFIHASLIDGARLSHAQRFKFAHNNLLDLEQKLQSARGIIYVVIESVYSMDGDIAPITEIAHICEKYNAHLIVDEAHATGVFGVQGRGLVHQLGLQNKVFARVVTFGKALGCHGAIVLGSTRLRNYLINFARSFIYTTALPIHAIASIKCAYQQLITLTNNPLTHNIAFYNQLLDTYKMKGTQNKSPIQTLLFNNAETAKNTAHALQQKQFNIKAILSPTVAEGSERIRICLHSFNSETEIKTLVQELKNIHP